MEVMIMDAKMSDEIAALAKLSGPALRSRYAELFGDETRVGNRVWLIRRIGWRLQSQAEGGLSERARLRAAELTNEADLRLNPPADRARVPLALCRADPRLPAPGSVLTRSYKGRKIEVTVREHGFEYEGVAYPSLSAVAKAITGSHCNGFLFFRLHPAKEAR
jgi:hypothetical protein